MLGCPTEGEKEPAGVREAFGGVPGHWVAAGCCVLEGQIVGVAGQARGNLSVVMGVSLGVAGEWLGVRVTGSWRKVIATVVC